MRVADVLTNLRACAVEAVSPKVCRAFKHAGPNAPHDICAENSKGQNGQLWVAHLTGSIGWPTPVINPLTCATPSGERYELGIVRCAKGVLTSGGSAPDVEDIDADADLQETDREALKRAILCCLQVDGKDVIIEGWEATEPQGGCVGGVWTFTIRDSGCVCS